MCGGVEYKKEGEVKRVYFPNPHAKLPLIYNDELIYLPWGHHKDKQEGKFIPGGWARLTSVLNKKWHRFHPIQVRIMIDQYMEKNRDRESHWFKVRKNSWIQGIIATLEGDSRVYVVTIDSPAHYASIHDRWPLISSKSSEVDLKLPLFD